ncbi:hypothetical protein [Granulicella sp. dw_53]|uniref:hypothetical protein n=1 Tax=Granulicella sp. dw_53 TaxID=2719792 RepID=UPI001BD692E3|nr:hypothetical protein [Granulicella sp. dw_53]
MIVDAFPHGWAAEALKVPPLIAPVRQYTYPQQIAGEEDALGRGALLLMVRPEGGGSFLATCALGFTDPSMPTAVYGCPNPDELCAVAGGYAYVIDTLRPERSTHISLKPVVRVLAVEGLLVFVGFHSMVAWGFAGLAWETPKLSWEGLRLGEVEDGVLHGFGWNLMTDKEVGFTVDLRTGVCLGGAFSGK